MASLTENRVNVIGFSWNFGHRAAATAGPGSTEAKANADSDQSDELEAWHAAK